MGKYLLCLWHRDIVLWLDGTCLRFGWSERVILVAERSQRQEAQLLEADDSACGSTQ